MQYINMSRPHKNNRVLIPTDKPQQDSIVLTDDNIIGM